MYFLLALMTLCVAGIVVLGLYLEFSPPRSGLQARRWFKGTVGANLVLFVIAQVGLLILGMQDVMAQSAAAPREVSVGLGLALIGIGIPTGLAAIGAALAVGPVGAAAIAAITEKPETFGRSLVYLGLAEGIAIYGLVLSILMLGRI
ncbi:MAG TPA: ATP synthase subunit C [Burkholderiales bacterium]|nr:ATP synthase subunit C [Burkholderiales bacterium]